MSLLKSLRPDSRSMRFQEITQFLHRHGERVFRVLGLRTRSSLGVCEKQEATQRLGPYDQSPLAPIGVQHDERPSDQSPVSEKNASDRAGARTQDLPLKRRLLYQLSYAIENDGLYPNKDLRTESERVCGQPVTSCLRVVSR